MDRPPEQAEVRKIKRSYQRFLNGNPYGAKAKSDAQAVVALCDSWLTQRKQIERLNAAIVAHHELSTLSDETIAKAYGPGGTGVCPVCREAAAGGETETQDPGREICHTAPLTV